MRPLPCVVLSLALSLNSCARSAPGTVVEVTPSSFSETSVPVLLTIRGDGLAHEATLSLDDNAPAQLKTLTVTLDGTPLVIEAHASPRQLTAWASNLSVGSYDLEIAGLNGDPIVVRDALRVLPSSGDPAQTQSTTSASGETFSQASVVDSSTSATVQTSVATGNMSTTSSVPEEDASTTGVGTQTEAGAQTEAVTSSPDGASNSGCVLAAQLFGDGFEDQSFDAWTASDMSGSCQTSTLASSRAFDGVGAFESVISCSARSDHENYGALQFRGDQLLTSHSSSGEGIDAPLGVLIRFWAWAEYDFDVSAGEWVGFLLLSGTCDWTDTVFSVATGNSSATLGVSHTEVNGGTEDPNPAAPAFPEGEWAQVTAYVNYHTSTFVVWQDGVLVTRATFVRPGTTLCHIRIGAFISASTTSATVLVDEPEVWKLQQPLATVETAPCLEPTP